MLFMGATEKEVAATLGIAEMTLRRWFAHYPVLDEARVEASMQAANVSWRLYQVAMGEYDPATGEYSGGDAATLRFLAERKFGFSREEARARAEEAAQRRQRGTDDPHGARLREVLERVGSTAKVPEAEPTLADPEPPLH